MEWLDAPRPTPDQGQASTREPLRLRWRQRSRRGEACKRRGNRPPAEGPSWRVGAEPGAGSLEASRLGRSYTEGAFRDDFSGQEAESV